MTALLQRYNVGRRFTGAFGVLIILAGLLIAAGLIAISQAHRELDRIVKVNVAKMRISDSMLDANSSILIALSTLSMVTSDELNQQAGQLSQAVALFKIEPASARASEVARAKTAQHARAHTGAAFEPAT